MTGNASIEVICGMSISSAVSPDVAYLEYVTFMLTKWWTVVVLGLGLPGNLMSLLITMKKDNRRISACVYMAGLAIVDSLVLFFSEITWKFPICFANDPALKSNFTFLSMMWWGADGFAVVSGLFLAEMSIDRAIAVIFPMKAATICTAKRAVKLTVTTCVLEMVYNIYEFFVLTLPDPPTGYAIRDVNKPRWFIALYNYNLLILATILPFATILVCNVVIVLGVNRAASRRKKMNLSTGEKCEKKIKDANLTVMLVMTSLAYVLLSCPKRIYESVTSPDVDDPYWNAKYWLGYAIVVRTWTVNFAINFYIYFLGGGSKFRQDALEISKTICLYLCPLQLFKKLSMHGHG